MTSRTIKTSQTEKFVENEQISVQSGSSDSTLRHKIVESVFAYLLFGQYLVAIGLAFFVSPSAWAQLEVETSSLVLAAVVVGGIVSGVPIALAVARSGHAVTKHALAMGQVLMGALFIHLAGGESTAHLHIFVSLALISVFHDWRTIVTSAVVAVGDHIARGIYWPDPIFGLDFKADMMWLQHAGWILIVGTILSYVCWDRSREQKEQSLALFKLNESKSQAESVAARRLLDLSTEMARSKMATSATRIGHWDWNLKTNDVYFSPEWKRQLGYEDYELPNCFETWESNLHPDERDRIVTAIKEYLDGRQPDYSVEFRLRHKDGSYRWIYTRAEKQIDEAGTPCRVLGCHVDITDRKLAEEQLRLAKSATATVLHSAPDPIIMIDDQGCVLTTNKAVEEVFQWKADEIVGRNVTKLMPDSYRSEHSKHIRDYLTTGKATVLGKLRRLEGKRKNGEVFPLELSVAIVETSEKPCFVGIIRDLSVAAKLEEELERARRLESIGQLAAGIAHEINTPTQYIGDNTRFLDESFGYLSPLLKKADELVELVCAGANAAETAQELKEEIKSADLEYLVDEVPRAIQQSLDGIGRVSNIVKAMKSFSHPGDNGMTEVDLRSLIESTITVTRCEWKYVAEVQTDFDPDLPCISCLPNEINQVLLNILVNAAHAISQTTVTGEERKGMIDISTRMRGDFAEVWISDTGIGIPKEAREKVFDPFFTTKGVGKGTGQGLSIAYGVVVKKHGGTLEFETESGKGTTFKIRLPIHGKPQEISA